MLRTSFARRNERLERMDTESFSLEGFQAYLRELEQINTWTLAHRPTLGWLGRALAGAGPGRLVSILDVGSGNGDMLRAIWSWGQKRGLRLELCGIDRNPFAKVAAEAATPAGLPIRFETADVFEVASERTFDVILCSLFTHHLRDDENVRFLKWLDAHGRWGWFINDLHRHPVPYYFIKYAARLLVRHPAIQSDAPLSVARAFSAADWRRLLAQAGVPMAGTTIRWFFPFRYCVGRGKTRP